MEGPRCAIYYYGVASLFVTESSYVSIILVPDCSPCFFKYLRGTHIKRVFQILCRKATWSMLFLLINFKIYQFVWNNWKQSKTFMSKWKKSKRMSHLQQSLELKWLFLKAATTQEILYFILPKEKKKGKEA